LNAWVSATAVIQEYVIKGLRNKSYKSYHAADEAAISRLYGGIRFGQAIENGQDLGRNVANYVLQKVTLR
jgi:hypothetical protein